MTEKIIVFYVIVFSFIIALKMMKPNIISFIAFAWIGPFPEDGELLSSFKLRRVKYALNWLLQFLYLFGVLFLLGNYTELNQSGNVFLLTMFAGAIGMGMAALASIGLFISWLKTIIIGPNRKFERIFEPDDEEEP